MSRSTLLMSICLFVGCGDGAAAGTPDGDAGAGNAGSTGSAAGGGNASPIKHVCEIGDSRPCECPGGAVGNQSCSNFDGHYSQCGCPKKGGADVLVPPAPPVPLICGSTRCADHKEDETKVGARHCCVEENVCGSTSDFVFGDACVERGGDPGKEDARCPDESPNFLDLRGCCRSDGFCGLSVDTVNNFDLGCIERSQIATLLEEGDSQRKGLSLIFGLEHSNGDYAAIRCD